MDAEFDPKAMRYTLLRGVGICFATVVGIAFLPFWLLGLGQWYSREAFERTSCTLTSDSLQIKKGVFIRRQINIPLEKLTDLTVYDGPILRYLGLSGLKCETAGQGGPAGSSEGDLVGILNTDEFRNAVDEARRDGTSTPEADDGATLREIRDALLRIESRLL